MTTRLEQDSLGEKAVPAEALYGIQTLRAVENFPISGLRPLPQFVDAVVWIKRAAARTHEETSRLEPRLADAIVRAADEVLAGRHRDQFVVDVYQAGEGTTHNMNVNEVLANRAADAPPSRPSSTSFAGSAATATRPCSPAAAFAICSSARPPRITM